jgi:hypothetical protein
MVAATIEPASKFHDFQAEYEGSIPFTRSKQNQSLGRDS